MGRFLKNAELKAGSYSIRVPTVPTTSVAPDATVDGQLRFNAEESKLEYSFNNAWHQIAKIGEVDIVVDTFSTQDGVSEYGDMSFDRYANDENSVLVFVGGVYQKPNVNYSFNTPGYLADGITPSATANKKINIDPSTGGTAGQPIVVIHKLNSTDAV